MDLNREFARLVGLCWHEYDTETLNCIHCEKVMWRKDSNNPDYAADPRLVLREMEKRSDYALFMAKLMYEGDNVEAIDWDNNIDVGLILDITGQLIKKAIEFLKEREDAIENKSYKTT